MADSNSPEFDPFAGPAIVATAPSTEPQREVWTASALGDDASLAFNESVTVRLHGSVNLDLAGLALSDLTLRHEALRMTLSGDGMTLCVGAPAPAEVERHDYRSLTPDAAQAALDALGKREVELVFDLTRGPLYRTHFVQLSDCDYALVFTAHHIVCDGWSLGVLMRDWATLYNARSKNELEVLPPPDSFSAYAREREATHQGDRVGHEAYWLAQFAGEIPVLDLPYDRPRPPRKTYRAAREDALLPPSLVADVRKAGAKSRASLFATMLAAFKTLVFRLSGQADLVIGIPTAGQANEGHPELVGHCVNMLPLRTAPRAEALFSSYLADVRKTLLDAQEHQDFTFGTLLTKLPIPRDPSRLPLVSAIFNVDRGLTSEAIGFEHIDAELTANPRSYENFDVFLNAVELDGAIELECQYNTDLFDAATIKRWLEAYRLLLGEIARNTERALGELNIVSEAETAQLAEWNATEAPFARDACVHQLFEARAAQSPNAIACEFDGAALSFRELDARSNLLASRLRGFGVRRGVLVGICLERGLDLLIGLLAILKAGGGYVPLDPGYPSERLTHMVTDSRMPVLLTHSALERELALGVATVVCIDREALGAAAEGAALPDDDDRARPEDICYVIYTSGSTGKPKGVLVPHRSVVNLLSSVAKRPGLTDRDVMLAITTLSFDIAVSEIWLPLAVGAKIAMVSRETASDGTALREVCERAKVTFIDATPATYRLLLAAGWKGGAHLTLICTGEAMPKDLAIALPSLAKAVWNGYGPTETTVWSTFWQVPTNTERVLIGRPVDNTRIYILDAQRRPVALGVIGEMYIAGAGVTHGYLNRPELSAERFVADPFDVPGARMYRTGDLARYQNNGDIECLGRNDNQIKLRGFRIELGEIEDALGQHAAVEQAAVILREDRPGDARLVAYFVAAGTSPGVSELRAHLKKTLPDYMVPADFVTLPVMPLTPSGKINRRALPAPDASQRQSESQFVAPRSATETLLAKLWATALNVGRVSVEDDFFALGGHSLLASQILARLRRDHGIELSFRKFFEAPTIARLAELIDATPAAARTQSVGIKRRAAGVAVPLSVAQERLWLLEEMYPAQRFAHNLPAAWRFKGPVDLSLLQQSLDTIAARHESLRMNLVVTGNRAGQRISEQVDLPIQEVDLRALPEGQREPQMFATIREQTAKLFDLEREVLFRSTLFRLKDEESVYFTVRHNIIWDGWSFDIFLRELCLCYGALLRGEAPELPVLSVSYGDYVLWQREWVKGAEMARQVAYWQKQLAGPVTDLDLPLDRPRPAQSSYAGSGVAVHLTRADAEALTALAHRAGTTFFNILFAGYIATLHRYSGQNEVLVGVPVRARNLPEVEDIIGPFINAIMLRNTVDPKARFLDFLMQVRDLALDGFSHEEMPLELLGIRPPTVRALFSFQDTRARPLSLGPSTVHQIHVEPPAAANDLMLWMLDRNDEVLGLANYNTEIFDARTIERIMRSFVSLLRDLVQNPDKTVEELSTIADEDRAELTQLQAIAVPESNAWLHDVLLQREAATPDAVAYSHAADSLSYRALAERARGVAGALCELTEAGSTVAIALPSSLAWPSAVFGVSLAGCSIAGIDPAAPRPYLERLLNAAQASVLITDRANHSRFHAHPNLKVLCIEDLSTGSSVALPRSGNRTSQHQPAWLQIHFGAQAAPVLTWTTHAQAVARAKALALEVATPISTCILSADPQSDSLPLDLVFGPTLGAKTVIVPSSGRVEQAFDLALAEGVAVCAIATASGWSSISVAGPASRAQLTAIVMGRASRELLARLLPPLQRVITVYVAPAPLSVAFSHVVRSPDDTKVIGKALDTVVSVLSSTGAALPVGAPGELAASGSRIPESGLRARLLSDGLFQLVHDASSTVVLSGQRFDSREVGRVLAQHPAVHSAFVAAVGPAGAERLVAYFQLKPGESFTDTALRRHVRGELPEAMVPQLLVELEALPLDSSGAVDPSRLPSPFATGEQNDFVAPRTPLERRVATFFAETLGVARVGVYDNFFDLGGSSILCFRVIERIEREVGKRLSPRVLLLSSLEQVAAELSDSAAQAPAPQRAAPVDDLALPGRVLQKLHGFFKR